VHSSALAQLTQELIRRNEERVLLKNTSNNYHRMSPHDINNDIPAKLGESVGSYDRIFISGQDVVQSSLILHQVIHTRPVFEGPFHMGN
jgi:hypothetical protein